MKGTGKRGRLLWLLRPEDSSGPQVEGLELRSGSQDKRRIFYAILKVFLWYAMALAFTIFLSRLH